MIMNKTELLLSEGWKFHFGECEEAWYQGYDDRAFERVMLPHDWAVAYPFSNNIPAAPDISRAGSAGTGCIFICQRNIRGNRSVWYLTVCIKTARCGSTVIIRENTRMVTPDFPMISLGSHILGSRKMWSV